MLQRTAALSYFLRKVQNRGHEFRMNSSKNWWYFYVKNDFLYQSMDILKKQDKNTTGVLFLDLEYFSSHSEQTGTHIKSILKNNSGGEKKGYLERKLLNEEQDFQDTHSHINHNADILFLSSVTRVIYHLFFFPPNNLVLVEMEEPGSCTAPSYRYAK